MNAKWNKKLRKVVNKKIKNDLRSVLKTLQDDGIFKRIGYAFRIIFKIEFSHTTVGAGVKYFLVDHDNIGLMIRDYCSNVPEGSPPVFRYDPYCRSLRRRVGHSNAITGDRTRVRSLGSSCPAARLLSQV